MARWRSHVAQGPVRGRVIRFLERAEALGCHVVVPDAKVDNYLNVRPPSASSRRGRIASVTHTTGSVEFQTDSADRLRGVSGLRHLPGGNKAALHLDSDAAEANAIEALEVEVGRQP